MADQVKVTKKIIDAVSENFSKLDDSQAAWVGNALGLGEDLVKQVRANPKSKQATEFFKNVIEKTKPAVKETGSLVNAAQALFDQATGRAPRTSEAVFKAGEAAAAKVGGGKPPPFEPSEARLEGPGGERRIPKPMPKDVNYTFGQPDVGEPGGPIVPAQTRALTVIGDKLKNELVPVSTVKSVPPASPEQMAAYAAKAKSGKPGQPIREGYRRDRQPSLQEDISKQMEELPEYNLGIGPSKRTTAKFGLGVAGAGAAAVGFKLFGDKPLSQQPDASSTVKAGDVQNTQELVDLTKKAETVLPPEQAQKTKENAEKIKTIEDLLADVEARKQQKVDRIELMQAIETMAHGLVTAIGAGVMLNRGSPFAVDFSKGPKVDWAAQLDRLQKDFDTQTNALIKKYGIEQEMKVKQEELALKKRGLDIEEQKVSQQITKQQAADVAKLNAAEQRQYKDNLKHYGDLRRAIAEKKPGPVQDAATLLGADDATIAKLTEAMNQGMWDKIMTMLGISEQPTTEQILQGLRPQKPTPQAAPAAPAAPAKQSEQPVQLPSALVITDDKGNVIERTSRPPNATDEKWKAYVDSVTAQNKNISKEF